MRLPLAALAGAAALAACEVPQTTRDAMPCAAPRSGGAYGAPEPDMDARMMCMEDEWAESKRELAEAQSEAMAEGREISPEVDAEVTKVLNRDIGGSTDDVRLEQLRDAVSDARRLAAVVSAG